MEVLNQKTIANAKSAYFLLFVSIFFLLNKENKYLNNPFVKNHTKTAFLLHLGFLLNYIIFISYGLGQSFNIDTYSLNNIIASTIFILLFLTILYGVYKAHNSKTFKVGEIIGLTKKGAIIDINGDLKINEKDKLTIILSYIPFIGYIIQGRYFKNETIKNISKLNLIITLTIILLYIFGNENIANLFSLFYIIFIVFSALTLVIKNEFLQVNLSFLPTIEEKFQIFKGLGKYLKIYFKKERFVELKSLINEDRLKEEEKEQTLERKLKSEKEIKLPTFLIYIPFINLISLFFLNSRYKLHIINGIIITVLITILIILGYFDLFYSKLNILFIFPIFYGIGYLQTRLAYKMPFIFSLYELTQKFFSNFKSSAKKIKQISKQENKFEGKVNK